MSEEDIMNTIQNKLEDLSNTTSSDNKLYVIDESHIFFDHHYKSNESRLSLSRVYNDTGFRDINNKPIRDSERLYKDGKNYRVELKPKSNEYYMYDEEDLNIIINLKDIDTRDYEITPNYS